MHVPLNEFVFRVPPPPRVILITNSVPTLFTAAPRDIVRRLTEKSTSAIREYCSLPLKGTYPFFANQELSFPVSGLLRSETNSLDFSSPLPST